MESTIQAPNPARRQPGIVVFGGGTATNSLVDVFERIRQQRGCHLSYVIPISDNGGSSSELIRVFGGPGTLLPLLAVWPIIMRPPPPSHTHTLPFMMQSPACPS